MTLDNNKNKIIILLVAIVMVVFSFFMISSDSNPTLSVDGSINLTEYQEAIVETAYQYYYRGEALQYDGSQIDYENDNSTKKLRNGIASYSYNAQGFYSPEEATIQDVHYLVCSHFASIVYAETFDNVHPKTSDVSPKFLFRNKKGTIGYDTSFLEGLIHTAGVNDYECKENNNGVNECEKNLGIYYKVRDFSKFNDEEKTSFKKTIINKLKVGDLIIHTNDNGGHVMIYIGNGKILHSTGRDGYENATILNNYGMATANYHYEAKADLIETKNGTPEYSGQEEGTVKESYLNTYLDHYLNLEGSAFIGIMRPLNEIVRSQTDSNYGKNFKYQLSDNAKKRKNHKRITVVKRTSVQRNGSSDNRAQLGKYDSVNLGDIINYEIEVRNKSSENQTIVVEEKIPEYTTFYATQKDWCKYYPNTNIVSCEMLFTPGTQKTFFIRVKVNQDLSLLGKYVVSEGGTTNGIPNKVIKTKINRTLTEEEIATLVSKAKSYSNSESFFSHNYINDVYSSILPDLNIINAFGESNIFEALFSIENHTVTNETIDANIRNSMLLKVGDEVKLFTLLDRNSIVEKNKGYERYYDMYVDGLFGGFYTKSVSETGHLVNRSTTFTKTTLMPGDVLYIYDSNAELDMIRKECGYILGERNAYLYLGNGEFTTVSYNTINKYDDSRNFTYCMYAPGIDERLYSNKKYKIRGLNGVTIGERLLISLLGQDSFIVLRPSYAYGYKVTEIEVTKNPDKTSYIQGKEQVDLKGGKLKVIHGIYANETIDLDSEGITVTNFDNSKPGETTATINYENVTTTIDLNVIADNTPPAVTQNIVLKNISIADPPYKTKYIQNKEGLDLTGGKLTLEYSDNHFETIKMTSPNVVVSGFSNSTLGVKHLIIRYLNKTITFDIEVIEEDSRKVEKIEVEDLPTKINYTLNVEELDLTDGTIKITYDDETTEIASMTSPNVVVSDFDNTNEGINTVSIDYFGKETTIDVNIKDRAIESVKIVQEPTKTTYIENETLDLDGGKIEVKYSDDTTEIISLYSPNVKIVKKANNSDTGSGNASIEIDYYGKKDTFNVQVQDVDKFIADYVVDKDKDEPSDIKDNNLRNIIIIISGLLLIAIVIIVVIKKKNNKEVM